MPRADGFHYLTYFIDLKTHIIGVAYIDQELFEYRGAYTIEIIAVEIRVRRLALSRMKAWEVVSIDVQILRAYLVW